VVAAPDLVADAIGSMSPPRTATLARAEIIDRSGVTLAQSATFDRLDAHPKDIPPQRRTEIVETLAGILDLRATERETYLAKLSTERPWDWLERRLTPEQSLEIGLAKDEGKLPGISLAPLEARVYPRHGGQGGTTLASHLLGFVAGDSGGAYGVERLFDDRLAGRESGPSGRLASIAGADAGLGDLGTTEGLGDLDGLAVAPLRLTIDARLQRQLESEISTARIADRAQSVSAIVMDPYTGAILATASAPGYDANDYALVAQDGMRLLRDPVVSDIYEPGSVMKIFTATAALERGVVTPQTKIQDQVKLDFGDATIRNSDRVGLGWLPVKDIIARSRNVGAAKIAGMLAPKDTQKAARLLYDLWDRVGLVGRTGVDMASEEAGISWDPEQYQWAPVDLANRAFGQSVGVTLLQLATGFSTLVNGGFRVQPHVVADGDAAVVPRQRVLKTAVAHQAQDILTHVTGSVSHYARGSLIPGYSIGGKTGTAQIWDATVGKDGGWKRNRFNHGFIGFVGANRPEVIIAVRIEEAVPAAVKPYLDLEIESYELFQMVARGAIKHLDIQRSRDPEAGLPILGTEAARELTPDRVRRVRHESRRDARAANVERAKPAERAKGPAGRAPTGTGPEATRSQAERAEPEAGRSPKRAWLRSQNAASGITDAQRASRGGAVGEPIPDGGVAAGPARDGFEPAFRSKARFSLLRAASCAAGRPDSAVSTPGRLLRAPRRAHRRPLLPRIRRGRRRRGARRRRSAPGRPPRRPVRAAGGRQHHRRGRSRRSPASGGRPLPGSSRPTRHRHHRFDRQDLHQGARGGGALRPLQRPAQRGQREQRDRPAPDTPASAGRAPGRGAGDGPLHDRRDRPAGGSGPTSHRGRDRGARCASLPRRLHRGHRVGQARAG
jgi:cell division protein FtsI (penicillin-binding protein 3)